MAKIEILPLDKVLKRITKGKLIAGFGAGSCFHPGNRAVLVVADDQDENAESTVAEVWPGEGDVDCYDAALMAHCWNRFPQTVAVMKMVLRHLADFKKSYPDLKDQFVGTEIRLRSVLALATNVEVPKLRKVRRNKNG